jgi:antitoxin ParD1/3/4
LRSWQVLPRIGRHDKIRGEKKGGTTMQTMNVSLPDAMKHFIDAQVEAGGYSSTSEYVRALVRDAQQRQAKARLETLLLEALDSGDPTAMTKEDWDAIRQAGLARLRARAAAPPDAP